MFTDAHRPPAIVATATGSVLLAYSGFLRLLSGRRPSLYENIKKKKVALTITIVTNTNSDILIKKFLDSKSKSIYTAAITKFITT